MKWLNGKIDSRICHQPRVHKEQSGLVPLASENASSAVHRSSRSVVDNTLDYQSRDHKIDPHFSCLSEETLNKRSRLLMTSLLVGC